MIEILQTDQAFLDSPNTGCKECICSRCKEVIKENEVPLRCWPTDEIDDIGHIEYRFCESCQEKSGIHICKNDFCSEEDIY